MDKKLFNIIKESDDFKQISSEVKEQMKGRCYCFVNSDKFLRDAFLEVLLSFAFCTSDKAPCGECVKCKQLQNNNNIDVCYFGLDDGIIKKEIVQELLKCIIAKPYEADRKFIVVKNADGLSEIDQNMLLKSLEELPEFVTVILMFSETNKVLPTIMSRSRLMLLHSLREKALIQMLGSSKHSLDIISCADGNMGKAFNLQKMKDFDYCYKFANSLMFNFNRPSDVIDYNEYLQANKERLQDILLVIKGVFYMAMHDKIDTILSKIKLAKIIELVSILEIDLTKKQNKLMIIDRLLFGILKIKKIN